jgi:hypothetical protein
MQVIFQYLTFHKFVNNPTNGHFILQISFRVPLGRLKKLLKPELVNGRNLSVGCGRSGSSISTTFVAVTQLFVSLLKVNCSLSWCLRTIYLWRTAISLRALWRWNVVYQKPYTEPCLYGAPPKHLDRMWHSPVFTSRFTIRIPTMIINRSYMNKL